MNKFDMNQNVLIRTGKYANYSGYVVCYSEPHHLSNKKRLQIKVQTGSGWRTLLVNEDNLSCSN